MGCGASSTNSGHAAAAPADPSEPPAKPAAPAAAQTKAASPTSPPPAAASGEAPKPEPPELRSIRDQEDKAASERAAGRLAAAEELLRACAAERARLQGASHLDTLACKAELATVLHSRERSLGEAEQLLREAIEGSRGALGDASAPVLKMQLELGLLLMDAGKPAESETVCAGVVATLKASAPGGEARDDALTAAEMVAAAQQARGDLEAAEMTLRKVVFVRHEAHGDKDPATVSATCRLAAVLVARAAGEYAASPRKAEPLKAEAEGLYRRVAETLQAAAEYGDESEQHPDRPVAVANLAMLLDDRGAYEEAAEAFEQALELFQGGGGEWGGTSVAMALRHARALQRAGGRPTEAEAAWREAVGGCEAVYGPRDVETLAAKASLATAIQAAGRLAEAEALLRETLAAQRETLAAPSEPPSPSAAAAAAAADAAAAAALKGSSFKVEKKRKKRLHPDVIRSLEFLSGLLEAAAAAESGASDGGGGGEQQQQQEEEHAGAPGANKKRPEKLLEAEAALREAIAARRAAGEEGPPPSAALLSALLRLAILLGAGQAEEAQAAFREHFVGQCIVRGPEDAGTETAREGFKGALMKSGKRESEVEREVDKAVAEAKGAGWAATAGAVSE